MSIEWKLEYDRVWHHRRAFELDRYSSAFTYIVKPNDTIWDISKHLYDDNKYWITIALVSNLNKPDTIMPGQQLECLSGEDTVVLYSRIVDIFSAL